jgi:hypothetical protein
LRGICLAKLDQVKAAIRLAIDSLFNFHERFCAGETASMWAMVILGNSENALPFGSRLNGDETGELCTSGWALSENSARGVSRQSLSPDHALTAEVVPFRTASMAAARITASSH